MYTNTLEWCTKVLKIVAGSLFCELPFTEPARPLNRFFLSFLGWTSHTSTLGQLLNEGNTFIWKDVKQAVFNWVSHCQILIANHNMCSQTNEPITYQSEFTMQKTREQDNFLSLNFWLVEKMARGFFTQSERWALDALNKLTQTKKLLFQPSCTWYTSTLEQCTKIMESNVLNKLQSL